jgi:hypothetical protein
MLLKLRFRVNSNPILSAKLLEINKLLVILNPLAGACFVFGMSDMQFCKVQMRAVKDKTDCLGIVF